LLALEERSLGNRSYASAVGKEMLKAGLGGVNAVVIKVRPEFRTSMTMGRCGGAVI